MDIDRRAVFDTARQRGPGLRLGPLIFQNTEICFRLRWVAAACVTASAIQVWIVDMNTTDGSGPHVSHSLGLGHVPGVATCEVAAKALHYTFTA